MVHGCRVRLLGRFSVEVGGRVIPDEAWRHRRGADLVKILALAPGHRMLRERLMDTLWPEFGVEAASSNLRKATYFARRALGSESAIRVQGGTVTLWPEGPLAVDVEEFDSTADEAAADPRKIDAAIALCPGDLLPEDRYADWAEAPRERARRRLFDLLRRARRWERMLELDRCDEEAHRELMRSHLGSGNRQAAIRQFETLRRALRLDLGLGPDQETVALYESALRLGTQPSSPEERVAMATANALVLWSRMELDQAEDLARQARSLAVEHGLGRELGEASTLLGLIAMARGRWPEVFKAEFLEFVNRSPEQAPMLIDAHLCFIEAALNGASPAPMGRLAGELLPAAEKVSSIPGEALMRSVMGVSAYLSGDLAESERELGRAAGLYRQTESTSGSAFASIWLAEVARASGRRAEALDLLAATRPVAERSELRAHLLVRLFAGLVRSADGLDAQIEAVHEAESVLQPRKFCGPCSIGLCVASAIACARSGDVARARKCLADAERLAGMWQGGPWLAATWEARAHLRAAEGNREQAGALLREAADLFKECGRPLDAARCSAGLPLDAAPAAIG